MNAPLVGLSVGTVGYIIGVPLLIVLALLSWGLAYHPAEDTDSSDQPSRR